MPDAPIPTGRRPLATRSTAWAKNLAGVLAHRRVPPNLISLASIVCAAGAATALWRWSDAGAVGRPILLVAAAAGIQLRLLCNMLDGMVAVEGGLRSPVGELYNEVPDRIADSLILVAMGYGVTCLPGGTALGWAAALVAMMTAYLRALGASAGRPGCFHGPMAKPHRMAVCTAACLVAAGLPRPDHAAWVLWTALVLVVVGAIVTCMRRLRAITRHLRQVPS